MRAVLATALACVLGTVTSGAQAEGNHVEPTPAPSVDRDVPVLPAGALALPSPPAEFLSEQHGFLRVVYHPSLYDSAQRITRDAPAVRAQLATLLGVEVLGEVEVRLGRTTEEVALLAPHDAPPPKLAGGAAYGPLRLVVLSRQSPETSDDDGIDEVFRHELAHLALFDATGGRRVPRWFDEGFAIDTSGEHSFRRAQTLFFAQVKGNMLSLSQLESFPDDPAVIRVAYAESADFVRFLARDDSRARFGALVSRLRGGEPFDVASLGAYGADVRTLEHQWRDQVGRRFVTIPLAVGTGLAWLVAAAAIGVAWRRRRKKLVLERHRVSLDDDDEATRGESLRLAADRADAERAVGKLLVVEEGVGHVVYIVDRPRVPTVEHDGKTHTLH
jgi:hypothetical protein